MKKEIINNELKKVSDSFESVTTIENIIDKLKSGEILGITFCTEKEEFNLELNKDEQKEWVTFLTQYKFHKKSIGTSSAKSAELLMNSL